MLNETRLELSIDFEVYSGVECSSDVSKTLLKLSNADLRNPSGRRSVAGTLILLLPVSTYYQIR